MNMFKLLSQVEVECCKIMGDESQKGIHFMVALQMTINAVRTLKVFF